MADVYDTYNNLNGNYIAIDPNKVNVDPAQIRVINDAFISQLMGEAVAEVQQQHNAEDVDDFDIMDINEFDGLDEFNELEDDRPRQQVRPANGPNGPNNANEQPYRPRNLKDGNQQNLPNNPNFQNYQNDLNYQNYQNYQNGQGYQNGQNGPNYQNYQNYQNNQDYQEATLIQPAYQRARQVQPMLVHTEEQRRTSHINNVMRNMAGANMDVNMEYMARIDQESKTQMLTRIDDLKQELAMLGWAQLENVRQVTHSSDINEIREVLHMLEYRSELEAGAQMAHGFALGTGHVLEYMFDGEKTYFNHQPNLSGWTDTVLRAKLHRSRRTLGMAYESVTQHLPASPFMRLLFDLGMSMATYTPRDRMNYTDQDVVAAQADLEEAEQL